MQDFSAVKSYRLPCHSIAYFSTVHQGCILQSVALTQFACLSRDMTVGKLTHLTVIS